MALVEHPLQESMPSTFILCARFGGMHFSPRWEVGMPSEQQLLGLFATPEEYGL
jgi:hypothetical protein